LDLVGGARVAEPEGERRIVHAEEAVADDAPLALHAAAGLDRHERADPVAIAPAAARFGRRPGAAAQEHAQRRARTRAGLAVSAVFAGRSALVAVEAGAPLV